MHPSPHERSLEVVASLYFYKLTASLPGEHPGSLAYPGRQLPSEDAAVAQVVTECLGTAPSGSSSLGLVSDLPHCIWDLGLYYLG